MSFPDADTDDDSEPQPHQQYSRPKPPPPPPHPRHQRTYYVLCALRLLLVLVPQTGYIHPDEFFQSLEPMAGDEFGLEHTRTWEFNATAPLRSIAVPYVTIRVPLNLLRAAAGYIRHYLQVDPLCGYALLVWPRLIMAALSFVNDWALRSICRRYNLRADLRLVALASSWVLLVFGTRTFSNAVEMALCSVLLAVVADCMHHSNLVQVQTDYLAERYAAASSVGDRVRLHKMLAGLPAHSLRHVGTVATLCAVGCFNRPTFVAFGAPAVFCWLLRGMGTRTTTFVQFNVRFIVLQLCALPALLLLVCVDSLYYGHLSLAEVQSGAVTIDNFVVTPLNFLRYNLNAENTGAHGVHAWWLHAAVHVPLLFNVLGLVAAVSIGQMTWRFLKVRSGSALQRPSTSNVLFHSQADFAQLPHSQSVLTLMIASIVVPLAALSCINHQEPRFLLPLTLPVVFTFAPELAHRPSLRYPFVDRRSTSRGASDVASPPLLTYWFTVNVLMAAFFGFVHQGGVVQLATHLAGSVRDPHHQYYHQHHRPNPNAQQTHLVTSHIYSVPTALLFLPSTQTLLTNRRTGQKYTRARTLHVHEYGARLDMDQLYRRLRQLVEVNERHSPHRDRVLLALPASLGEELALAFWRSNTTRLRYRRELVFYPHLSTEALPRLSSSGRHPSETAASVFGKGALAASGKCTLHRESDAVWADMWAERTPSDWVAWSLRQFSGLVHQFGLALYRIELAAADGDVSGSEGS